MNYIQSAKNNQVKQWKKLHQKKYREETMSFMIEGDHLIEEAVNGRQSFEAVIIHEDREVPSFLQDADAAFYHVSDEVIAALSETKTPQGIVAICKMNNQAIQLNGNEGKYLLIDGVQDPGNLGTLIRTADAAGLSGVIAGEGCTDLYNSKTVRATQGSLFHLPVIKGNLHDWIKECKQHDIPVYGSSLKDAAAYQQVEAQSRFALIVGNEGNGVEQELLAQTTQNLYVPIFGKAESLNVGIACGILLYHLRG